ncbi:MAG: hypothetical protein IPN59_08670 [Holophaga sp.]|nr:hypothetical protein [Holophaga sp.]
MPKTPKHSLFFPVMFGVISLLFIGILIVAYRVSVKANPIMLDERGQQRGHS